ncbi:hypothetical protein C1H84_13050 [Glutamicibacter soli]|uniref:Uncharacterized protein n=1 Tax=Glutamicibacter soli TaxID=453836 RepID=A0A365YDF4_9MICC|nr:hypothetical protein [Glutamicibacter soli]RBM00053.1 hypothetical protein C1H84_13050 [Glutamicibacter soli]
MKKMLPLLGAVILALTSCTTPVSQLGPLDRESPRQQSNTLQFQQPVEESSPEEIAHRQEVALHYPPLMYLAMVGISSDPTAMDGIGFWQGEIEQRGYHGLVAWAAQRFQYQQGGTLAPEELSLETDGLPGPYLIKYTCSGSGRTDVRIKDGPKMLRQKIVQCSTDPNVVEFELDEKNIENLVIELIPELSAPAGFEVQVIQ